MPQSSGNQEGYWVTSRMGHPYLEYTELRDGSPPGPDGAGQLKVSSSCSGGS